jgi:hypothetical protein
MEQEVKVLKRKLTRAGVNVAESMDETNEELEKSESSMQVVTNENESNKAAETTGAAEGEQQAMGAMSDFEIKEIDVLKYKYEHDIIDLRKEYEHQIEVINVRVGLFVDMSFI